MARKSKKFRVAFIGAGGIAGAHMEAYKKMDDVEIVAAADVSEKGLAARQEQYGIEHTFTDYKKMLADAKQIGIDGVDICTPNGMHAPASIAASQAGCHAVVEKPLAMNVKEANAMIAAAKKARKKLCIGFQWRYDAKTQYLKEAIDAGQFGDIMYARCQALRRRGIPNWGVFGRKELQGGGPMIDIGVHIMEVAHYTMGSPKPVSAFGQTWTYMGNKSSGKTRSMWPNWDHKTYNVEDLAVGQIRFDNGAMLSIEASFAGHLENRWNFEVMGTKGGGNWDKSIIYRDDAGFMKNISPEYMPKDDMDTLMFAKLRDFVDHSAYNKPSIIGAEHGLMVQKMLDGIYESAAKGSEVKIK